MKHCTHCGGEIAEDAKFCTWCGAALAQDPAPTPAPASAAAAVATTAAAATTAATGTYPSSSAGYTPQSYGQTTGTAQQTYTQPTYGQQTYGQQTYTQPTTYGQTTYQQTYPSAPAKKSDGLGIAAIVFLGLSLLINLYNAIGYASISGSTEGAAAMAVAYGIASVIAIVLLVLLIKKVRTKETIPTWFKVVTLIFGSLISGILLFVRKEDQLR